MNLLLIILNVGVMAKLGWWLYASQPASLSKFYWPALVVKVIAGIALGCIYFYYYTVGDTLSFWNDGKAIAELILSNPGQALSFFWDEQTTPEFTASLIHWAPRSLFFSKICGLTALLCGGNYWIMATWLSMISFMASWMIFRRIVAIAPQTVLAAAAAFLYVPSVVFWSSGLIKESVGLASLYVLLAIGVTAINGTWPKRYEWLLMVLSLWVGWNLKYYWIGILLPVSLAVVVTVGIVRWRPAVATWDMAIGFLVLAAFLALGTNVHPNFYASRFLEVIAQNNLEFTRLSDPPRIAQYLDLEPALSSVLLNAPAALIAGLFRPFVWEAFNLLSLLAGLENLVVLLLVIQAMAAIPRLFSSPHRLVIMAALVYTLLLITFLALSTPNFGTLSRYRIGALPLFIFLCLGPLTPVGRWLSRQTWFG